MKTSIASAISPLIRIIALITTSVASILLTPEAVIGAPRRGAALPNPDGTLALYTVTEYSFNTHKTIRGLYVLDISDGTSWLFSNKSGISNLVWLGDGDKFVWLAAQDDGSTKFLVGDARKPEESPIVVGSAPGPIDGLKLARIDNFTLGVAFSGQSNKNGTVYNPKFATTHISSGRIYTKLFVRHWDYYITPEGNSIWYATLTNLSGNGTTKYTLGETINALSGTKLESPIPIVSGVSDYTVGKYGIAFVAKDPNLNHAVYTKSDVYYLPLTTFAEKEPPKPQIITTPNLQGSSSVPVFSPSGVSLVFNRMKHISYESDKRRIQLVKDVTKSLTAIEFYATEDGVGAWDRGPTDLSWSRDGEQLFARTPDFARVRVFVLPASPELAVDLPKLVFKEGSTSSVRSLANGKLLMTSTSFVDNSIYSIVDPVVSANSNATSGIFLLSGNLEGGKKFGLSSSQVSEFFYRGDGDYDAHGWIVKPSFFKEDETYPLFLHLHGGPQSVTGDSWSTLFNLAMFAEQGYVVIALNPTGSTSFGQSFTDGITNQWGGRPYNDIVLGWQYVHQELPYVNTDRAVAVGASYGGYLINWIQGQDFGRKFKALFTHDGSFNLLVKHGTDELWFIEYDFNGTLWDSWDNYARWNPANFTDNWATPHLIVHSDKDYRIPISEGLAAFNVLQERGVESIFLNFPDEGHSVTSPENVLVWDKTALDFLNSHVGLPRYSKDDDVEYRSLLNNGEWF